jgi:hypothetical protein
MKRVLVTGSVSLGSRLAQYIDDQDYEIQELSGNNLVEAGLIPVGLINSIQHKARKLNAEFNSQAFIQQKMQGKRRVY